MSAFIACTVRPEYNEICFERSHAIPVPGAVVSCFTHGKGRVVDFTPSQVVVKWGRIGGKPGQVRTYTSVSFGSIQ